MSELPALFSLHFAMVSGLSLIWGAVVVTVIAVAAKYRPSVSAWRELWFVSGFCILLAFVLGIANFWHAPLDQVVDWPLEPLEIPVDVTGEQAHILTMSRQGQGDIWSWLTPLCQLWLVIYTLVLLVRGVRLALATRQLRQWLRQLSPVPPESLNALLPAQLRFIERRGIRLLTTGDAVSPFVAGGWKPYLVLPEFVLALPPRQQQLILEHELTHLRRRDTLWLALMRFVGELLWFNPLVAWMRQRHDWAVELSCDAEVLREAGPRCRKLYAASMLTILKQATSLRMPAAVRGTAFLTRGADRQSGQFKLRFGQIIAPAAKPGSWRRNVLLCPLAGMSALLIAGVQPNLASASGQMMTLEQDWLLPLTDFRISARYGITGKLHPRGHRGIDLAAAKGTPIYAVNGGRVVISTDHYKYPAYGKVVMIEHGGQLRSFYTHMDSRQVEVGQLVQAGELLGTVGTTGKTTGPHLHLEIRRQGQQVDPGSLIAGLSHE